MSPSALPFALHHRCYLLAICLGLFLFAHPSAYAQPRILPNPSLLPSANPLCDSNLVSCLRIDDFAAHASAHLQVLSRSDRRDAAAVFPVGVALGVFGRVVGSVSTAYTFWQDSEGTQTQWSPLRLSLTVRLLPIFPGPPQRLQLGLSYEHEARMNPLHGANTLGLLSDLGMLRLLASKSLGPFELLGSIGVLFDPTRQYETGEIAAQLGMPLPFLRSVTVYVEGLVRGWPLHVQKDAVLPALNPSNPLPRQAVVGGGISFRPTDRAEFVLSVQAGIGGLAPSTLTLSFITLSAGRGYEGRAASPLAQLTGDNFGCRSARPFFATAPRRSSAKTPS